jgi:cob(I)alamin adenosyltransferase
MKIYTKSGDLGETSLWGGSRVKKSHPRVSAYGTLDEANSMIGLALSFLPKSDPRLARIQAELFQVGTELATHAGTKNPAAKVSEGEIQSLEREIDAMEATLEPLKNFILPSGGSAGSALHLARTIVRRAERECVDLAQNEPIRPEVVQYLNRLSDYLFVMARYVNHEAKLPETKWIPPKA